MSDRGDPGPPGTDKPAFAPRGYLADVRKFSAYVLVPGHRTGKDRIFIDRLGLRPRSDDDARFLADLYVAQARIAAREGQYRLAPPTQYGTPCTIVVRLRGVNLRSGWFLRPNGTLELVTPFSGCARTPPEAPD